MKVKELIEQLENYDPDFEVKIAEVKVNDDSFWPTYFIENEKDIDQVGRSLEDDIVYIAKEVYEG